MENAAEVGVPGADEGAVPSATVTVVGPATAPSGK